MKSTMPYHAVKMHPQSDRVQLSPIESMWNFAVQKDAADLKSLWLRLQFAQQNQHFIVRVVIVIHCPIWIGNHRTLNLLAHIGTLLNGKQTTPPTPWVRAVSRSFKRSASSRSFSTCSPSKVSPRTCAIGVIADDHEGSIRRIRKMAKAIEYGKRCFTSTS